MKAKIFTILGSLIVSSILYAQNIQVTNKWQLLGALENINSSSFDNKCIDFVWKYNNGWQVHITNGKNYNLPSSITRLDSINKGQGFWIKGNKICDINSTVIDEHNNSITLTVKKQDKPKVMMRMVMK